MSLNGDCASRVVMLLQPGYMPWIGFFEQALRSDLFVAFDDTQYTKGDWRNRNRIKTRDGKTAYLTVPVRSAPSRALIREIRIVDDSAWIRRHANLLRAHYGKQPYFAAYFPAIERILSSKHAFLNELNLELIRYFLDALGGHCQVLLSSALALPETGKQRLLGVARHLRASICYNGAAGRALYDSDEFARQGVSLLFQDFRCPEYPQEPGAFTPNLSILDLLFRLGPASRELILAGGASAWSAESARGRPVRNAG